MRPLLQTLVVALALLAVAGCGTLNYEGTAKPRPVTGEYGGNEWSPMPTPGAPLIRF